MPRVCTICTHPERAAIDESVVSGEPNQRIATRFGVTESAIRRHIAAGHITETVVQAVAEREELSAQRLVEISANGLAYLVESIEACRNSGDHRTLIAALRELRDYIPFMESRLGLTSGGSSGYQNDPEWQTIRLLLVEIAREYPQVRPRVLEIIGDADGAEA